MMPTQKLWHAHKLGSRRVAVCFIGALLLPSNAVEHLLRLAESP